MSKRVTVTKEPDVVRLSKFRQVDWSRLDISVNMTMLTAKTVYEQYRQGIIFADPDIQREYEWNEYTASRWIESLIFGLPVPPVMLIREGEKYMILDGLQRIYTIYLFFENKLRLRGVDPTLEGKTYSDLPREYKNALDVEPRVPAYVISIRAKAGAKPEDVLYGVLDLFRRINLGAKKLTTNQVIFCTIRTSAMKIVKKIADEVLVPTLGVKDVEKKMFLHRTCALVACLDTYYNDGIIRLVTVAGRSKWLNDMLRFLAEEDMKKLQEVERDVTVTIRDVMASTLGITREKLQAHAWGWTSRKVNKINIPLFALLYHTAYRAYCLAGKDIDRVRKVSDKVLEVLGKVLNPDNVIDNKKIREWYVEAGRKRGAEVKFVTKLGHIIDQELEKILKQ